MTRSSATPAEVKDLSLRLGSLASLRHASPSDEEPAAYRLAYSLSEIEHAAACISQRISSLAAISDAVRLEGEMAEIREDLRHLVYHVRDALIFDDVLS